MEFLLFCRPECQSKSFVDTWENIMNAVEIEAKVRLPLNKLFYMSTITLLKFSEMPGSATPFDTICILIVTSVH